MKKNILVLATTFPRWKHDTEPSFVYDVSNLLAKKYNVHVLVPHFFKTKKFERMENLKVHRFSYFFPTSLQKLCYEGGILPNLRKSFLAKIQVPFLFLFELSAARRLIKKENIDLIHAHWIIPSGFVGAILKKLYKISLLVTVHAGDIFPLKSKIFRFFGKFTLKNSNFCTVNSRATKREVLKLMNVKNIEVIPMGVNLSLFSQKKRDLRIKEQYGVQGPFILTVGRLAEKKGIRYLIGAMPLIVKKFPSAKLLIVGDGPEKEHLMDLTHKLQLSKNIIFTGKIQNKLLPQYYATADVFVGPSIVTAKGDTEGLGVVFLEAIASGTCVIGSGVGGIPDIIKDRKTGLLVEQKNSKQIAEKIIFLLKNKEIRKKLVKEGQKHINEYYSWNVVKEKFLKLYKKII